MALRVSSLLCTATLLFIVQTSFTTGTEVNQEFAEDHCLYEIFQPRCQQNEIIKMKSATYGRMRMGRCITAEEVETIGSRHLGCSADILPQLDRKCTRKTECNIRITDLALEGIKPCPSGLNVYLEATYDCIRVADEKRSCVVDVSSTPIHIIGSKTCGTKSQPWIVEAPVGQKISISLIVFPTTNSTGAQRPIQQPCHNKYGAIVDKVGKQNITICASGNQREKNLYLSAGNAVEIFLNSPEHESSSDDQLVILSLQAIGCTDIIPPEDAFLKRSGDNVVVGCYTSRKTWHLNCEDGKWIGVIGNCSQGSSAFDLEPESEPKVTSFNNEQVLIILAVGGFTVAICLAIICFGAVCLRRAHSKKMKQEYKTLGHQNNSSGNRSVDPRIFDPHGIVGVHDLTHQQQQEVPNYSVFIGDGEFNDEDGVHHSIAFN